MDMKLLDRGSLAHEYGVESQRLLPWPVLTAPFEGAYCVVRPGGASTPHSHHEYEMFIAMTGEAVIDCEGERRRFASGDVVFFKPGAEHQVRNESDSDFEMFSIWWDDSMSKAFGAHPATADAEEGRST